MLEFPLTLSELAAVADQLRALDSKTSSEEEYKYLWHKLSTCHQPVGSGITHKHIWHRARRCEKGECFNLLSELIYPPLPSSKYGRAHKPGSKVLYAGSTELTALDEINARSGEKIQIIQLRVKENALVVGNLTGNYERIHATQKADPRIKAHLTAFRDEELLKLIFVDSFIADRFRQIVPDSRNSKYLPTAVYAERFLKNSALTYPSVKNLLNSNLAISSGVFDNYFEVVNASVIEVLEAPGFSVYRYKKLAQSCSFEADGKIQWNVHAEGLNDGGISEGIYRPGWRVS